jgi:Holliday junction resolvase RusA-like endonuclease
MELSFFIRSRPVAKQSFKMGKFGGYKPKAVANWEAEVRLRASQAAANQGWVKVVKGYPVSLDITVTYKWPKAKPANMKWLPEGWGELVVRKPTRPDTDNLTKGIKDGLRDLWDDDSQVTDETIVKRYGPSALVGVLIRVRALPPLTT